MARPRVGGSSRSSSTKEAQGTIEAGGAIQLGEDEAIETEEGSGEGEEGTETACRALVHRHHQLQTEAAFLCLLSKWAWETQLVAVAGATAVASARVGVGQMPNRSSVVPEADQTIR